MSLRVGIMVIQITVGVGALAIGLDFGSEGGFGWLAIIPLSPHYISAIIFEIRGR